MSLPLLYWCKVISIKHSMYCMYGTCLKFLLFLQGETAHLHYNIIIRMAIFGHAAVPVSVPVSVSVSVLCLCQLSGPTNEPKYSPNNAPMSSHSRHKSGGWCWWWYICAIVLWYICAIFVDDDISVVFLLMILNFYLLIFFGGFFWFLWFFSRN